MSAVRIPEGFRWENLAKRHPRRLFQSDEPAVDEWLKSKALQNQEKRLSSTRVLLSENDRIAGFYTLATNQVDFNELPLEIAKNLPKRVVPVAVLAWLGVDKACRGQGLGQTLVAQALGDCYEAGKSFAFVAVLIDCLNASVKTFYQRWNFREAPGRPLRLFLSAAELAALVE